jgi:transitional endoplasmic reticulum ATPase
VTPSEEKSQVELKTMEAYTRDVGRGVARLDYDAMDAIGVSIGDVVLIEGKKSTVAKVLPLYPSDEGRGLARIDGLIRNNAGTDVGAIVKLSKLTVPVAETLVARALDASPQMDGKYIVDSLDSVPVRVGDTVMLPYFGGRLSYVVDSLGEGVQAALIVTSTKATIVGASETPEHKAERERRATLPHYREAHGDAEMNALANDYRIWSVFYDATEKKVHAVMVRRK